MKDLGLTVYTDTNDISNRTLHVGDRSMKIDPYQAIHFVVPKIKGWAFEVAKDYEREDSPAHREESTFIISLSDGVKNRDEAWPMCLSEDGWWFEVVYIGEDIRKQVDDKVTV